MSKKKVTALLLSAAVILSAFPVQPVAAAEEKPQAEEEESEEEEKVASVEDANKVIDSYQDEEIQWETVYIENAQDLKEFARDCWLDTWSQNKKVFLTEDISLSGESFVSIPTFWV